MEDYTKDKEMCSENITELAKAMLKVQQAIRPASKDSFNEFTKSKYATLTSVMGSCRSVLIDNGIWVTQYPIPIDSGRFMLGLVTKLIHVESGQWQSSMLVMPLQKNDPQGYGSALTYARRYGLSALVGIVTEDDDGHVASNHGFSAANHVGNSRPVFQPQNTVRAGNPVGNNPQTEQGHANTVAHNKSQASLLPKVDGVIFKSVKSSDGSDFITATGKTTSKKAILKQSGFRWDPGQKLWWKQSG